MGTSIWKELLFLGGYAGVALAQDEIARTAPPPTAPKEVVAGFLREVRSGRHPEWADRYLAPHVVAHQLVAEAPTDVDRTPADYAAHVRDFRAAYGEFRFELDELLADGDRVYARWRQLGCHVGEVDGYRPTRRPVVEVASAVYRVQDGRIVEYWIQVDRAGTEAQLRANADANDLPRCA